MERNSIKLTFTGDILVYACENKNAKIGRNKYDYAPCFDKIKSLFEESDYVIGSLETTFAGKRAGYTNSHISFNTPDDFLLCLKSLGFNMLTTANNHCLDRGKKGLLRTLEQLDRFGFDHTGTFSKGKDLHYFVKDFEGTKVSFVSYTYGTNSDDNGCILDEKEFGMVNLTRKQDDYLRSRYKQFKLDCFNLLPLSLKDKVRPKRNYRIVEDCVKDKEIDCEENKPFVQSMIECIREARQHSDFVVFCLHSGGQFNNEVGPYTKWLVDKIVEEGVGLLICNHAHCVLPIEHKSNGTLVAYGLGNFSFTPGEGYYIDGAQADYSICLNAVLDSVSHSIKTVDISYLKNIKDNRGYACVVPVENEIEKLMINKRLKFNGL